MLLGPDRHEILAPVERHLADAGLSRHALAHHGKRLGGQRAVRRQVVRTVHVDRIDVARVGELHEIDDQGRLDTDLLNVLFADDHVPALFELVSLGQLGVRHLTLAVRTPPLLLNAGLTLGVQLVEG